MSALIRPATPGFLVTLGGAVCLALVTFSVPYLQSIYFLKGSLEQENISGSITFGTLGYCLNLPNGTTCSKPSIGYQLDINGLVGNDLPIQIPNVLVKWITYALFLHVVALILAAGSAVFGLLAHCREFSMACCSTCISGFAAAVALLAFIFDVAFFFIVKGRINALKGGSATIGIAVWLTLAAWICLFFAGCFYGFGRCCISKRPRGHDKRAPTQDDPYAENMRLDAVKAEADRKARQKHSEVGLPAFQEQEHTPLTKHDGFEEYIEDGNTIVPYSQYNAPSSGAAGIGAGVGAGTAAYARHGTSPPATAGGYAQAPTGTRAVDDYYNRPAQSSAYPPRRQMSGHTQTTSGYAASTYSYHPTSSPPPPPVPPVPTIPGPPAAAASQYLSPGSQQQHAHEQYPSAATQNYGHAAGGTSYHSAITHQQYPSTQSSQFPNPYSHESSFDPEAYNASAYMPGAHPTPSSYPAESSHYNPYSQPDRSYTLGGDGYNTSGAPESSHLQQFDAAYSAYYPPPTTHSTPSPAPIITTVTPPPQPLSTSPRGPRPSASAYVQPQYEDSPPVYDAATSQPPGEWGAKH